MKREKINDLRCDAIHVEPIHYDWSGENFDADGDGADGKWSQIEPTFACWTFERCAEFLTDYGDGYDGDKPETDDDDDPALERIRERCRDAWQDSEQGVPVMSYYYPIPACPFNDGEIQDRIVGLPLCAVRVNGETVLALTGGGMDFSWEIAEAYTRIGLLPPLHFRLPMMAGRDLTPARRFTMAAMRRSATVSINWARSTLRDLRHLAARMREEEMDRRRVEGLNRAAGTVTP